MKKIFSKNFLLAFLFIFILSLVPLLWFGKNNFLVGHDNVYPIRIQPFLVDRFFTWSEHHGLGYDQSSAMGSIMIHLIDGFPALFGVSDILSQRFVYVFWFAAILTSAFICGWMLQKEGYVKSALFKYIFATFYAFNFYTLQGWWIGERTKFSLMVVLPIAFIILLKIILGRGNVLRYALIMSLVLFVFNGGGARGLPLYGGMLVVCFATIVYELFYSLIQKRFIALKRLGYFLLLFLLFSFFLNAYYILPFLSQTLQNYSAEIIRIGGSVTTFGWVDMISMDASYSNLIRFQGIPEWYTNLDHPYGRQIIQRAIFIIPSFFFIAIIFIGFLFKKNKLEENLTYVFLLIFLLGLLFSAGSHEPLGFLYKYFIEHVPGFAIFRSALYKFGYAMWFGGAGLFALSISLIYEKYKIKYIRFSWLRAGMVMAIVSAILLYHYPFLTGNIFDWSNKRLSTRVEIPSYIYNVADWAEDKEGRILLLPEANPNWTSDVYTWKFYSLYPLMANLSRKPFLYNHDGLTPDERQLLNSLYTSILRGNEQDVNYFADILGVKYFIVRNDYYYDLSWTPTISPEEYTKSLSRLKSIELSDKFGKWDIYRFREKEKYEPFFASNAVDVISLQSEKGKDILFSQLQPYLVANGNNDKIIINNDSILKEVSTTFIENYFFITDCASCNSLTEKIIPQYPSILILPSSPLYGLTQKLKKNNVSFVSKENEVFDILGRSLIKIEEISQMQRQSYSNPRKIDPHITSTLEELNRLMMNLQTLIPELFKSQEDELRLIPIISAYLQSYQEKLSQIMSAHMNKPFVTNIITTTRTINSIRIPMEQRFEKLNPYSNNYYYPEIEKGSYNVYYLNENVPPNQMLTMQLNEGGKVSSISGTNNIISAEFRTPNPEIILPNVSTVTENQIIEETIYEEDIVSNVCYGQQTREVKKDSIIRVNLRYFNNLSTKLRLVIVPYDETFSNYKFSNVAFSQILAKDEDTEFTDYFLVKADSNQTYFVGLCMQNFSLDKFNNTVKDLEIYVIENSPLLLQKTNNIIKNPLPILSSQKIDQTKYIVTVRNAQSPYILSFFEKFNNDWKVYETGEDYKVSASSFDKISQAIATLRSQPMADDKHFIGNRYHNSWYIDKPGSYTLLIEYRPQSLFYVGLIITGGVLIVLVLLFLYILRK